MHRRVCFRSVAICVFAFVLAVPFSAARADLEFTLAGSGSADSDFDSTQFSGDAGLGFVLGPFILGARQTVTYNESPFEEVDDFWSASTRGFADVEFKIGPFAPFVGAMGGYVYGDLVDDQFIAGPEGGLKLFIGEDEDTFIFFRAEYQFFFEDSDEAEETDLEDGQWVFALGVGVRF